MIEIILVTGEITGTEKTLEEITKDPRVIGANIRDAKGKIITSVVNLEICQMPPAIVDF